MKLLLLIIIMITILSLSIYYYIRVKQEEKFSLCPSGEDCKDYLTIFQYLGRRLYFKYDYPDTLFARAKFDSMLNNSAIVPLSLMGDNFEDKSIIIENDISYNLKRIFVDFERVKIISQSNDNVVMEIDFSNIKNMSLLCLLNPLYVEFVINNSVLTTPYTCIIRDYKSYISNKKVNLVFTRIQNTICKNLFTQNIFNIKSGSIPMYVDIKLCVYYLDNPQFSFQNIGRSIESNSSNNRMDIYDSSITNNEFMKNLFIMRANRIIPDLTFVFTITSNSRLYTSNVTSLTSYFTTKNNNVLILACTSHPINRGNGVRFLISTNSNLALDRTFLMIDLPKISNNIDIYFKVILSASGKKCLVSWVDVNVSGTSNEFAYSQRYISGITKLPTSNCVYDKNSFSVDNNQFNKLFFDPIKINLTKIFLTWGSYVKNVSVLLGHVNFYKNYIA